MTRHRIEQPRHKRNYHVCLDRLSLIVLFYRLTYHSRAALGLTLHATYTALIISFDLNVDSPRAPILW